MPNNDGRKLHDMDKDVDLIHASINMEQVVESMEQKEEQMVLHKKLLTWPQTRMARQRKS